MAPSGGSGGPAAKGTLTVKGNRFRRNCETSNAAAITLKAHAGLKVAIQDNDLQEQWNF